MKKKYVILGTVSALLITAFLLVYFMFMPRAQEGIKNISVEIIYGDETWELHEIATTRDYLGNVLVEKEIITGEDGPYGLYITAAGGVTADESRQEWWCITKDNEMLMTSVDATPLEDGAKYELTLKTGYDE